MAGWGSSVSRAYDRSSRGSNPGGLTSTSLYCELLNLLLAAPLFPDTDRLVVVYRSLPQSSFLPISSTDSCDLCDQNSVFESQWKFALRRRTETRHPAQDTVSPAPGIVITLHSPRT